MEDLYGMGLPVDLSVHGPNIDLLINVIHIFAILLFVGWGIFLTYAIFKYRYASNSTANYVGIGGGWSKYLEGLIVLIEVALLVGISAPVWADWKNEVPESDENALRVRVVSQQFAWNVHYPGPDGVFGRTSVDLIDEALNPLGLDDSDPQAEDDFYTINHFHIPTDRNVIVYLSSKDVIHSFFLPILRVKQDAIPGMEFPIWFQAKPLPEGVDVVHSEISCAQLCGVGHYRMRGELHVHSPESFETWVAEQMAPPEEVEFDDFDF